MGESTVEIPVVENMMGESLASGPTLEVSVSFGKFENDELSWEKWSSFSPNKYLEEVEKFSTPGSVAQKKAYFEAHYKKIGARKVELLEQEKQQVEQEKEQLEQEKQMTSLPEEVAEPKSGDQSENTQVSDYDFSSFNGERSAIAEQPTTMMDLKNTVSVDEPKGDVSVDVVCDSLLVTEAKDVSVDVEFDSLLVTKAKEGTVCETSDRGETVKVEDKYVSVDVECDSLLVTEAKEGRFCETSVQGETLKVEEKRPEEGCQDSLEETSQVVDEVQRSSVKKIKNPTANVKNVPRKIHKTAEDRVSAGTKKKLTSPVTKSSTTRTPTSKSAATPKISTPSQPSVKKVNGVSSQRSNHISLTQSKKVAPKSLVSPSQSSTKKLNGATLQKSKNSPVPENKKVAPTSLHMSLSFGSPNSTASTTTLRKSLIMESMGDKDIVKRAFRTFQNSLSQGRTAGDTAQLSSKGSEQKISSSLTPQKESERLRKASDKVVTQKGQSGTRSTSQSSGALRHSGMEKKKVSTIKTATGLRPDRSADVWK